MNRKFFAFAIAAAIFTFSARARSADKTLDIYWMDVEGGGGTLIVTPAGESVMIDTGNPGGRDAGRIHHVATEVAGLKKIDHLVTTHFHTDHFGGAAELSKLMPIGVVHDNGIPEHDPDHSPNDARFLQMIKPYREMTVDERVIIKPDDVFPLKQSSDSSVAHLTLRCLAAKQRFTKQGFDTSKTNPVCSDAKTHSVDNSDNLNSVVVILDFGPFRFFDGGDLTWNTEGELVCPVNRVGTAVDVYQVDHHGLDLSNNPLLIRTLAPTVSVISNGTRKGCEPNSFAALKAQSSLQAMYQIHKNLRNDGATNNAPNECIANLEAACAGNYIKMSVAPDGKTYSISIPATSYHREFQTKASH